MVFFAKGYRFDIKTKIFVYSGSITIKSVPKDIEVFLNDKQQNEKRLNYINNAYTINGVRPGKYSLRLEKDNHTSWEKDIEVHSGISTEFWNILLFPNKEVQEILSHTNKNIEQFFLSPRDEQEIIFFSEEDNKKAVYLLDAKNNNADKIFETDEFYFLDPSEEENVEWSSDNKHIFIPFQDEQGIKIYIIAKIKGEEIENPVNLNEIFNNEKDDSEVAVSSKLAKKQIKDGNEEKITTFKKVRWMFDKTDELVILTNNHELYYLDFNKPEERILIDDQVSGFDFAGNRIYYTQLPNNLVWEIKNDNTETKRQITNQSFVPSENGFIELTVYDEYRLTIKDEFSGNLLIFNEEKEENEILTKIIENNIKGVQFSNDGKKLLYWSDSEIWFLILRDWDVQPVRKKGDNELITRFSTPIKNVQWLDNYENILFSSGNKIKSAEIDVRNHVNIVDIVKSSQDFDNRDFFYNKKNQMLFFKIPEKINDKELSTLKSIILLKSSGIFGFGG